MKKIILYLITILGILFLSSNCVYAIETGESTIPEIYIRAINPGYTVDGVSNVGEIIEIGKNSDKTMVSLAGLTIGYTNSSGNYAVIAEFPENSWMTGESILLRLASSLDNELAAMNYTKTLAFKAGPLVIMYGDELIDSVCWDGKDGCNKAFKSSEPTTLVRNLETGEFEHKADYEPIFDSKSYFVEPVDEEGYGKELGHCKGLVFSEVLSYYEDSQKEQFIEFYNSSSEQILMDGCRIRYKNKYYDLNGIVKPEKYYVRYLDDFSITKNPNNFNTLELIDSDDSVVDKLDYPNGQRKGTSYAFVGYDSGGNEIWRLTYAPTPGEPNNYQEFKTCEEGKVINEATGNCVKVTSVTEKTCPEGQYLNPLTGRCKKVSTAQEKVCKEGYYLNEETGRCKKIKENNGADYSLVAESYEEKSSFVALYVVIGIVCLGLIYVIYEFRHEISKLFRRVFRRFH